MRVYLYRSIAIARADGPARVQSCSLAAGHPSARAAKARRAASLSSRQDETVDVTERIGKERARRAGEARTRSTSPAGLPLLEVSDDQSDDALFVVSRALLRSSPTSRARARRDVRVSRFSLKCGRKKACCARGFDVVSLRWKELRASPMCSVVRHIGEARNWFATPSCESILYVSE